MALQQVNALSSILNVEFKRKDFDSSLNPSSTGAILHLTNIDQGDGDQNRDGTQCKLKSVEARWVLRQNASATQTAVRFFWFIDNEQDGTAPTMAELLESGGVRAFPLFENRKRFTVLKEMIINLGDNTMADGRFYKKMNMIVNWEGISGTTARNNHLYFAYLSSEATNTPELLIQHRLRFIDN